MRLPRRDRSATAVDVWRGIRNFVDANEHAGDLRERLGLGLGSGRVRALLLLKAGPLGQAELAEAHHVTAPYATIIIDQLESLGYVQRAADPTDRRRKLVSLTKRGQDAVEIAENVMAEPPPALDVLSDDELEQLNRLLERIAAAGDRTEP